MERMTRRFTFAAMAALVAGSLVACAGITPSATDPEELPTYPYQTPTEAETETPTPDPDIPIEPEPIPEVDVQINAIATGLSAPWGLAELPLGSYLITERDNARLGVITAAGEVVEVTGPGAEQIVSTTLDVGEGGLLGVALHPDFEDNRTIVLYRTTRPADPINQVFTATLSEDYELTVDDPILSIPAAPTHNGGAVAFGPDGYLYVGTGDAGEPELAQDLDSLAGKILRVDLDGAPAPGNPLPGSPVWSLGHRNVQGFDWDADGTMYASEFGANAFDELNMIVPGGNYGWPVVEGMSDDEVETDNFRDPLHVWPTSEASPSGLAVTDEGVYLAGLRGERLWRVPLGDDALAPQELLAGEYGRLRNVITISGGDLVVLTNNTDGRGQPGEDDDQLLRLRVRPAS